MKQAELVALRELVRDELPYPTLISDSPWFQPWLVQPAVAAAAVVVAAIRAAATNADGLAKEALTFQ